MLQQSKLCSQRGVELLCGAKTCDRDSSYCCTCAMSTCLQNTLLLLLLLLLLRLLLLLLLRLLLLR